MEDNRPVGVDLVTTSSIPINRKHSHINPHMQLISSTVHTADLINDNRSHLPPPHIKYAYDLNPDPIAEALIPLLGSTVGCVDWKLKFSYTQNNRNMVREMDHSSLPLDAQCRAAEEELR